jgi:hypothetical protein
LGFAVRAPARIRKGLSLAMARLILLHIRVPLGNCGERWAVLLKTAGEPATWTRLA